MALNFGDVDKVESAANFYIWPLALCLETHSTFRRLTDMTTTCDEDIDLESGENVRVGHTLKYCHDFWGNGNF